MSTDRPILYSFRRCPYAMRARMAIWVSGKACALREVVLRDKPQAMLEVSPKGTVPVLVLEDGSVLEESLDVMNHALSSADPEGWLEADAAATQALITACDQDFKGHLDRYKYPTRYENVDPLEHREAGLEFLKRLEAQMAGNAYLFGANRTKADIAIFPFVRQFANSGRTWFDAQDIKGVHNWLDRLITSDLFTSIMKKFPQWQEGDQEPLFPDV